MDLPMMRKSGMRERAGWRLDAVVGGGRRGALKSKEAACESFDGTSAGTKNPTGLRDRGKSCAKNKGCMEIGVSATPAAHQARGIIHVHPPPPFHRQTDLSLRRNPSAPTVGKKSARIADNPTKAGDVRFGCTV